MRLNCKTLKMLLSDYKLGDRIYKGHNEFTHRPKVRMDLTGISRETKRDIKLMLYQHGISIYQDNPVNLPFNYVVTY